MENILTGIHNLSYSYILMEEADFGVLDYKGSYNNFSNAIGEAMALIWAVTDRMRETNDKANFKFVEIENSVSSKNGDVNIRLCLEYDADGSGEYNKIYYHIIPIKKETDTHDKLAQLSEIINGAPNKTLARKDD